MIKKDEHFVAGADFGSDSVRVVILDAADGSIAGSKVAWYPRWKEGRFCEPRKDQFRQHPLDYTESLTAAVRGAVEAADAARTQGGKAHESIATRIRAISIDTTGSTPAFADANGSPLALLPAFAEDPDAMFILCSAAREVTGVSGNITTRG